MKKAFILMAVSAFLLSCQNDDPGFTTEVEGDLNEYIQRFEEEATRLGFTFDMSTLDAIFVDEIERNGTFFCGWGYSNYGPTGRPRIEIDRDCWLNRSDLQKEQFFFHEIGHAIIKRAHDEGRLPNRSYKTLMCGACNQFDIYTKYFPYKREYYISELISPFTPVPEWAVARTNFSLFFEDLLEEEVDWIGNTTGQQSYESFIDSTGDPANPIRLGLRSDTQVDNDDFALWRKDFDSPDIEEGASVRLRVTVELENVQGDGVAIALRGDDLNGPQGELVFFETTQRRRTLSGTVSNLKFDLTLPNYSRETDRFTVFLLLLANTSGTVYFDDISLETAVD